MIRRRHFFAINADRVDQMPGLRKHLWIYRPTKTKKEWKGRILPTVYLLPLHFRTGPQRSYLFSGKQVLQRHKAGEHLHRNLVKIFIRHIDHTLYHKNILCVFRATVLYWIMRYLCLLQEENMIRSIGHIWEFMIDYCRIRKENTMSYGKHGRSITNRFSRSTKRMCRNYSIRSRQNKLQLYAKTIAAYTAFRYLGQSLKMISCLMICRETKLRWIWVHDEQGDV